MSTQLEINGVTLLPIKEAAALVSYSRDYVAKLARERKIVATQMNRQWFVDVVSLRSFAEVASLEAEVRKQQLSAERKREQTLKQQVSEIRLAKKSHLKRARVRAPLVASLVLFLGLATGGVFYSADLIMSGTYGQDFITQSVTNPANVQLADADGEVGFKSATAEPVAIYTEVTEVTEVPLFIESAEVRAMTEAEGILLLSEGATIESVDDIKSLFSDEVDIEMLSERDGVVTYRRSDGTESNFPFVYVPNQGRLNSNTVEI
jgi:hypothetical protein